MRHTEAVIAASPSTRSRSPDSHALVNRREFILSSIGLVLLGCQSPQPSTSLPKEATSISVSPKRPQPAVLSRSEKRIEFLKENFVVISGNAPIEDAQVLCFGEDHADGADEPAKADRIAIMEVFAAKNDIHLVEAHDYKEVLEEIPGYPPIDGVTIRGWDDMQAHAASEPYAQKLREALRLLQEDPVKLNDVLQASNQLQQLAIVRNDTMFMSLKRAKTDVPPRGRVYVTAGLRHFADDPRLDKVCEDAGWPFLTLGERKAMAMRMRIDELERKIRGQ